MNKNKPIPPRIINKCKAVAKYVRYKWIYPLIYRFYYKKPINQKLVIFADHRDRKMEDNFVNLYNMCIDDGYTCVVLSGSDFSNKESKWKRIIAKLKFELKFITLYAQCTALFLVDYFALAYIVKPHPETRVIQLWHACGMLKKAGYSASSKSWGMSEKNRKRYPMHRYYTLVPTSSEYINKFFAESFHCPINIFKPLGIPRTDIYFDEDYKKSANQKVRQLFPDIGNKKIILYAPTFRGRSIPEATVNLTLDFSEMSKTLSEEYVIFVKFHPLMTSDGLLDSQMLKCPKFLYNISTILTPDEALCAADILITDYSSIVFEYLLLERPIIAYIPDIDTYANGRGFYEPYDQLVPGPYVFSQKELVEKIQTVPEWFDVKKIRWYKDKLMSACDGHSTERIFKEVFGTNEKEVNT